MEKDYHWVLLKLKQIIFNIKVLGNNSNNQKKNKTKSKIIQLYKDDDFVKIFYLTTKCR